MLTQFAFPDAQIYLRELNGSDDAVIVLRRAVMAFDDSYDTAEEKHTLIQLICSVNVKGCDSQLANFKKL